MRPWFWSPLLLIGVAALIIWRWASMAQTEREQLLATVREHQQASRAELAERWGALLDWTPPAAGEPAQPGAAAAIPDAEQALAVTPRHRFSDFDAIYTAFVGDRAVAVLALTPVAGYFNGERLDLARHSDTLIGRKLTAAEREGLRVLIGLLERRLDQFEAPTDRHGWTQNVLRTARQLESLQETGGGGATDGDE